MSATCSVCELHAESTFKIEGMDCREEVALLERRFKHLPGLEDFSADLMGQRLHVRYDAAKLSAAAIAAAVADAGMRAWLEHEAPLAAGRDQTRQTRLLALSLCALAAGFAADFLVPASSAAVPLFGVAILAGGALTVRKALQALRLRSLDIHVLMLVAAAGAVAIGEWAEAGSVVFLFAVAQALEARTLERARLAIRALMDLTPSTVLVRDAHGERTRPIDTVAPGACIVIKPGDKIPLDGVITTGASAVNQAPITGESLPVDKSAGDAVFAGSINGHGALDVEVTKRRQDTTLARIIHMVEQAQTRRAPSQAFVDRFARIYTPAVIAIAALIAVGGPLALALSWEASIYRALVLLVVSCPCALVISTPVSIVAALAGAARKGVLVKGGAHLERAGRVRCVAFDKTGTLTHGRPEVKHLVTLDGVPEALLLATAAAVEQRTSHPLAEAIVAHARHRRLLPAPATGVIALSGRGAEGTIDQDPVVVGNHALFEERGLCAPELHPHLDRLESEGHTLVFVARRGRVLGMIALADTPRLAGRDTVETLKRQGVAAVVMLTGDSAGTAERIARAVGVDEVRAGLLPEDKVTEVEALRRRFGVVAMVGDGVNDAPALAAADVGVAMGAAGSAAALETADVALMADELLKIPYALRVSRAAVRNIQMNLAISLVMKGAFVVAAVAGAATLWMAVIADTGASIIVVANALRLLRAD